MRLSTQETARPILDQFEDLSVAYRLECEQGIPMSVHERYERRLARLRQELRSRGTSCRLGDVLKRMGSLDDERLADALRIQSSSGGKKLLGEILIELGWASEQTIRRAVEAQARLVVGQGVERRNQGQGD